MGLNNPLYIFEGETHHLVCVMYAFAVACVLKFTVGISISNALVIFIFLL